MKPSVLFICVGNSCRSQMAEGFLRHHAGDRFEVASAGTNPTTLNPDAVEVMREVGIDISRHQSKPIRPFLGRRVTHAVTVCEPATERCPIFPGVVQRLQWRFDDPAEVTGPDRLTVFRRVRDEIDAYIRQFIGETVRP